MKYHYKSIKFAPPDHEIISDLAKEIQGERGTPNAYLPPVVMEAIKFFKEHRKNPYIGSTAGTPGGKVGGAATDTQAQPKGVITE